MGDCNLYMDGVTASQLAQAKTAFSNLAKVRRKKLRKYSVKEFFYDISFKDYEIKGC